MSNRFRDYAAVFCFLAILWLAMFVIVASTGCENPADVAPEVDDAFCLVLCIAVELNEVQPTNEVATDSRGWKIVPCSACNGTGKHELDSESQCWACGGSGELCEEPDHRSSIAEISEKINEVTPKSRADTPDLITVDDRNKSAGARNSRVAIEDGERPALKAADTTPLSFSTFTAPIILHTKANCPPCREVKAALLEVGIPFTEHATADVAPVAFVDGERLEGYKILDRFNIKRKSK